MLCESTRRSCKPFGFLTLTFDPTVGAILGGTFGLITVVRMKPYWSTAEREGERERERLASLTPGFSSFTGACMGVAYGAPESPIQKPDELLAGLQIGYDRGSWLGVFDRARLGFGGGPAYWRWQLIVFLSPHPCESSCCSLSTSSVRPSCSFANVQLFLPALPPFFSKFSLFFLVSLSLSPSLPASSTVSISLSLSLSLSPSSCLVSFSLFLPFLVYVSPCFLLSFCCFLPFSMDRGVPWPSTQVVAWIVSILHRHCLFAVVALYITACWLLMHVAYVVCCMVYHIFLIRNVFCPCRHHAALWLHGGSHLRCASPGDKDSGISPQESISVVSFHLHFRKLNYLADLSVTEASEP